MIEFGGIQYYIDIEALDKTITPTDTKPSDVITVTEYKTHINAAGEVTGNEKMETSSLRGKEINGPKYNIIQMMVETLIDYTGETDDSLGAERALNNTPLSYKLAFNTLYQYGIIKEKE